MVLERSRQRHPARIAGARFRHLEQFDVTAVIALVFRKPCGDRLGAVRPEVDLEERQAVAVLEAPGAALLLRVHAAHVHRIHVLHV